MNPNCPICKGLGWVCENHPELPWSDETGCQCGAGMTCQCNRTEGHEEPDVTQLLDGNDIEVERQNNADAYDHNPNKKLAH